MENRSIKFRVWTGEKMEYNVMAGYLGAFYVPGLNDNDKASINPLNTKYPDNCPIMQFTGMLDVNGREIYEGDVCEATYPGSTSAAYKNTVLFKDGCFWFASAELHFWEKLKVLGNCYQG